MKSVFLPLLLTFFGSLALGQRTVTGTPVPECLLANPANPYEVNYTSKVGSCAYGYSERPHYFTFKSWQEGMCPSHMVSVYTMYSGVSCLPINAVDSVSFFLVFSHEDGAWKSPGYHSFESGWKTNYSVVSCSSSFPSCVCLPVGTNVGAGVCTQPKVKLVTY